MNKLYYKHKKLIMKTKTTCLVLKKADNNLTVSIDFDNTLFKTIFFLLNNFRINFCSLQL